MEVKVLGMISKLTVVTRVFVHTTNSLALTINHLIATMKVPTLLISLVLASIAAAQGTDKLPKCAVC